MAQHRILIVGDAHRTAGDIHVAIARLGYAAELSASTGALDAARYDLVLHDGADQPDSASRLAGSAPVVHFAADAAATPGSGRIAFPCSDRELQLQIELALTRANAQRATHDFDNFFAVAIDMFCFLGFDGYFRRLNPAWERTLGFTREELMSRRFIEFVHPDDRERTLRQNAEVRAGGQALGFENRYLCRDGGFRWFLWNAAPQPMEGVIYSVARDITARKEAELERQRLVTELQESLAEVRALRKILPICSYCRNVRDDENYWQSVERYVARHTNRQFSHGICPSCMASEVEPMLAAFEQD